MSLNYFFPNDSIDKHLSIPREDSSDSLFDASTPRDFLSSPDPSFEVCKFCKRMFDNEAKISCQTGLYHSQCFVCAQCFREFPDGVFYAFEGRNYCQHDFQMLYAPICGKCGEFIEGRRILARNRSWHPECFECENCSTKLTEKNFQVFFQKSYCEACYKEKKAEMDAKLFCFKCKNEVTPGKELVYAGMTYHPFHFDCSDCGKELDETGKPLDETLYCGPCFIKHSKICAACRRPVEERAVIAMDKYWHPDHFLCVVCEKPFYGEKYFTHNNLPYCKFDYTRIMNKICFRCQVIITDDEAVQFCSKVYCINHFKCFVCDKDLKVKSKLSEIDQKPVCLNCMEKLPKSFRRRLIELGKLEDSSEKKKS